MKLSRYSTFSVLIPNVSCVCLAGGGAQTIVNNQSTPLTSDFVSLHLKGRTDGFALKASTSPLHIMNTLLNCTFIQCYTTLKKHASKGVYVIKWRNI